MIEVDRMLKHDLLCGGVRSWRGERVPLSQIFKGTQDIMITSRMLPSLLHASCIMIFTVSIVAAGRAPATNLLKSFPASSSGHAPVANSAHVDDLVGTSEADVSKTYLTSDAAADLVSELPGWGPVDTFRMFSGLVRPTD